MDIPTWPTSDTERCARPGCGHQLSNHETYGCRASFAGEGPSDPGAGCCCDRFDPSAFIARTAQVQILRDKVAICQEEARIADTRGIRQRWEFMAMWLHNEAAELEST